MSVLPPMQFALVGRGCACAGACAFVPMPVCQDLCACAAVPVPVLLPGPLPRLCPCSRLLCRCLSHVPVCPRLCAGAAVPCLCARACVGAVTCACICARQSPLLIAGPRSHCWLRPQEEVVGMPACLCLCAGAFVLVPVRPCLVAGAAVPAPLCPCLCQRRDLYLALHSPCVSHLFSPSGQCPPIPLPGLSSAIGWAVVLSARGVTCALGQPCRAMPLCRAVPCCAARSLRPSVCALC